MIKKTLLVLATISVGVMAAEPAVVTFKGEVTAQTCKVTIAGSTNNVVMLPTVSSQDFTSVGGTAGLTPVVVSLTDCQADSAKDLPVKIKFLGRNVTSSGNLGNMAVGTTAANGVSLQLMENDTGTNAIKLNGVTSVAGPVIEKGQNSATYKFGVQYVSDVANVTPGEVVGVAEYTVGYF